MHRYVYDAWNRLVKVQSSEDSGATTFQTTEFYADGRRAKKVVTNSGDYDGTVVYLYNGQRIIETHDGSGNMVQQFIHGTRYIDELVMMRVADKGNLYVHQDANNNVQCLTDLGGSVVERYVLTPYGKMIVDQETSFGDYDGDGDGDVDSNDRAEAEGSGTCRGSNPSGACRILDIDFDNDVDDDDLTLFDALVDGTSKHPGRLASGVNQPFGHQGLLYEPEIGSYQNRARQYDPQKRRFVQRDPISQREGIYIVWKNRAQIWFFPTPVKSIPSDTENYVVVGSGLFAEYSDGMSLHEYVGNNPLKHLDILGLKQTDPHIGNFPSPKPGNFEPVADSDCIPLWGCRYYFPHDGVSALDCSGVCVGVVNSCGCRSISTWCWEHDCPPGSSLGCYISLYRCNKCVCAKSPPAS